MVQIGDTFKDGSAVFKVKKFGADGADDGALVGSVTWYAGAGTPENYLLCDGSAVSRTDYADLFVVISTTYGAGDGSTTFKLPNLTDNRFIEGSTNPGTYKNAGLPDHRHGTNIYCNGSGGQNGTWNDRSSAMKYTTYASADNSIYGKSNTVQPQSLTLRPLIKYI